MFFKQIFVIILYFSVVMPVLASTPDVITFSTLADVQLIPCFACPVPGKECSSFIETSTDKICLPSNTSYDEVAQEEEIKRILHEQANAEDVYSLQNDISYPEQNIVEEIVLEKGLIILK